MAKPQTIIAITSAKILARVIKLLGKGGATAAPGLLALRIDPSLIANLTNNLKEEVIVVSGTNGKTTTARIISSFFSDKEIELIHNRSGSNLLRGIASLLITKSSLFGNIKSSAVILEIDEATLPLLLEQITPKVIVLTNLFRDQLDRYGEINTIARKWKKALEKLTSATTLILNADDPMVAHLGHNLKANVVYFGLEDPKQDLGELSRFADSKYCSFCATPLDYEIVYISHLGKYTCPNCQKGGRPKPTALAHNIQLNGLEGSSLDLVFDKTIHIDFKMPGLYNVYNALAAFTTAVVIKIPQKDIKKGIANFQAAFGRVEKLKVDNHDVVMFLVKNPTGFNEVIRTLFSDHQVKQILIAVNDKIADGQDISWLWDVDFEKMSGLVEDLVLTGTRAYDLGLRLKYAQIENFKIEVDIKVATSQTFINLQEGQTLYILPTYTAMLEIRQRLNRIAQTGNFWED